METETTELLLARYQIAVGVFKCKVFVSPLADIFMSDSTLPLEQIKKPCVSVVMAVRNMERFLSESIESILGQTLRDFEFIVLDFGSTDNSMEIAARYAAKDSRIKLREIPNCTLVEARNAGCSLANGRFIAVQDADDISLPDRLQWEVDFLENHQDVGLLGGQPEWIDAIGRPMWIAIFPTDEQEVQSALLSYFPFCHTSLLIRKEAFDLVGGYRPVITQSHDYDLALRISEHFRCANLQQVVVKYRIHPHQVSLSKRRQQTLCKLASQASAASRRSGMADPLDTVLEITPDALISLGVTEAQQQSDLVSGYQNWIESMIKAGELRAALTVATEALQFRWEHVDRTRIDELHFTTARLYWQEKRYMRCFLSSCHTVATRPEMARRFAKVLCRRLGLI